MKNRGISFYVSLTVLVYIFMSCPVWAGEVLKITSLDWQPYSGSDMPNKGNSVEKLKSVLKKEGIDIVIEFYPWLRAQNLAKTKEYIGYFPAWPEEVKEGFIASPPVDYSALGALTYEGSGAAWTNAETVFSKYRVGVIQTYVYPKDIEAAIKKYPKNVDYTPDEESLAKKLSAKRFAIGLTDPKVMGYYTDKLKIKNIVTINKSIENKALVIALRNDQENKNRIEQIKAILIKLEK